MKSISRVLPYIWPQWPRLIVVFLTALVNGVLFSVTIASIIPILTVMMGQEGLHGWVDRAIAARWYGADFYVTDKNELSKDPNLGYMLRIVKVKSNESAAQAGIKQSDVITSVHLPSEPSQRMPVADMLQKLAQAQAGQTLILNINRGGQNSAVTLTVPQKPWYAESARNNINKALAHVPGDNSQKNKEQAIFFLMLVLTLITFIRCLCRFLQDYTGDKVVQTTLAILREKAYGHTLRMPVGFFVREGGSDTVSRLVQDTGTVGSGVKTILTKAIREPITAISMLACAFIMSPKLTLVFMCGVPAVIIAVTNLGKKIKRATKKSLQNWAKVLSKLEESITALKIVKIYNREKYEHGRFSLINRKQMKHQFRIAKADAATDPMMEMLGMLALSAGIIFGSHWAFSAGNAGMTTFFAVLILLGSSAEAIRKTSDVWNRLNSSNAAAERVFAILDQPLEQENPDAVKIDKFKNTIEFKDVRFTYPGTERQVLNGIDLIIRAGQNVAIVGPNGSGKTTLVNLLPRFYDVNGGAVLLDGLDVRNITLESLRAQMAMVTQNVITFNDTVGANIAYGKPDATLEEIITASKHAYAHEFIEPLPEGYETIIGEQGAGLSGGQLQRIVIARAILRNPPIIIFDEAMSQIDADSESKIHKALDEFMKNRTSFVIAHRFSTVIKADKIVVMNEGRIVAVGTHDELVETCPLYQNLYQTQLLKDS